MFLRASSLLEWLQATHSPFTHSFNQQRNVYCARWWHREKRDSLAYAACPPLWVQELSFRCLLPCHKTYKGQRTVFLGKPRFSSASLHFWHQVPPRPEAFPQRHSPCLVSHFSSTHQLPLHTSQQTSSYWHFHKVLILFPWWTRPLKAGFTYLLYLDNQLIHFSVSCFVQILATHSLGDWNVLPEPCKRAPPPPRSPGPPHTPSLEHVSQLQWLPSMCLHQQDGDPSRAGTLLYAWHPQQLTMRRHLTPQDRSIRFWLKVYRFVCLLCECFVDINLTFILYVGKISILKSNWRLANFVIPGPQGSHSYTHCVCSQHWEGHHETLAPKPRGAAARQGPPPALGSQGGAFALLN